LVQFLEHNSLKLSTTPILYEPSYEQVLMIHHKINITFGGQFNQQLQVPHRSLCVVLIMKPFRVYRKWSPYAVVKKRMGDQRVTIKGSTLMQAL